MVGRETHMEKEVYLGGINTTATIMLICHLDTSPIITDNILNATNFLHPDMKDMVQPTDPAREFDNSRTKTQQTKLTAQHLVGESPSLPSPHHRITSSQQLRQRTNLSMVVVETEVMLVILIIYMFIRRALAIITAHTHHLLVTPTIISAPTTTQKNPTGTIIIITIKVAGKEIRLSGEKYYCQPPK